MKTMKTAMMFVMAMVMVVGLMFMVGCDESSSSSDKIQQNQQETILKDIAAALGMPAIKNYREKRLLKEIYELRDQDGLITYTYIFSEMTGKYTFVGESIGYGIPAATQYTNPQKIAASGHQYGYAILPQADPNGLFSPTSAEGTWVMMRDPNTNKVRPQYIESRISTFTYKLPKSIVTNSDY